MLSIVGKAINVLFGTVTEVDLKSIKRKVIALDKVPKSPHIGSQGQFGNHERDQGISSKEWAGYKLAYRKSEGRSVISEESD